MSKKILSLALITLMITSLLIGCGYRKSPFKSAEKKKTEEAVEKLEKATGSANSKLDEFAEEQKKETTNSDSQEKYSFVLDGKQYVLPMSFSELASDGWVMDDDGTTLLKKNQQSNLRYITKDNGPKLCIKVANLTDTPTALSDSSVIYILCENEQFDFSASGLKIGDTKSDMENIFGVCEDVNEDLNTTTIYRYVESAYQSYKINTSKEDIIQKIEIQNPGF
ncbi:hypothetical protein M2146_001139 [Lachnospiraceae bacterium PF1-22]